MSSISSISGGSSLYSYLQNLSGVTESQATTPATATTGAGAASDASATDSGQSVQGGHHHHGHGKGGQSQLFQQIQQAVTSALQSAQQNGSTDPNETIEDAIASVFKNQTSGAAPQVASGTTTPDADGDSTGAASSSATGTSGGATQAFFQSLQSLGIDPQQFHQDFLAAVQDSQSGAAVSASSLFQNLPVGSIVDQTA
ncbi:MAG TPA: hypothetical protein VG326_04335 [Tepidisphaeraceae bacterium]|jgi:hypothetical protein|nr:hypothetical protein [Tepidisphaeraceae bacterium]